LVSSGSSGLWFLSWVVRRRRKASKFWAMPSVEARSSSRPPRLRSTRSW
jgi:hypothetical protein